MELESVQGSPSFLGISIPSFLAQCPFPFLAQCPLSALGSMSVLCLGLMSTLYLGSMSTLGTVSWSHGLARSFLDSQDNLTFLSVLHSMSPSHFFIMQCCISSHLHCCSLLYVMGPIILIARQHWALFFFTLCHRLVVLCTSSCFLCTLLSAHKPFGIFALCHPHEMCGRPI